MQQTRTSRAPRTFCYALLAAVVIFLPFVIYDGGYFLYYGDFNVQQIPFYRLAHEAVRSGDIFWNWNTDLGVNFIGSYSFYLLFSPFFWLTLPFPTEWVPFMMAPLLALKTACAALTAHLYLRRFVKDEHYAVIGAMLYAFSGWMAFNVFFNHFHEAAVFFPLLLLGVEKLVTENKRGLFAAAVLVNAAVNYWFFAGEAVFVLLYVLLRATDKSWGLNLRKLCRIAWEAALGFCCAAAAVVPSVLALLGNPRTGTEELLTGWNVWLYWHEQRQPAILQSLFFPPELPARPNFLPDHGAKWASLSGWLPLFSMTGVLAYFFRRRDDWLKKTLALCLVFALVPVLNSAFVLLNNSYYARWFYMPVLLMAMATVRALEDCGDGTTADFSRGVKWTAVVLIAFTAMSGLTPNKVEGEWVIGLADNPTMLWIFAAIALVCLVAAALLVLRLRKSARFRGLALVCVLAVAVGFQIFYIANGKSDRSRSQWIIDRAINGGEQISLPDSGTFSRVDVYDGTDNLAMFWGLPTIQAFHSIVPPSVMEFYPQVGVTRDVGSRPEAELYALRPLLSVRWLFIEANKEEQAPMPGYHFYDEQNGFCIYENDNFLPMGFSYDAYVTPAEMEDISKDNRGNLMLRAVVLEDEAVQRNRDILWPMDAEDYFGFDEEAMARDAQARRLFTADRFAVDRTGFTAATSFDEPRLLFFSVPWDKGWSATLITDTMRVPLRIEKANLGFMAVRVPEGACTVRFAYETPGLRMGLVITGGCLLLFAAYLVAGKRRRESPAAVLDLQQELLKGRGVTLTWEEYQALLGDKEARAAHLKQTLDEAAAHPEEELDETDRTLHFQAPPEEAAPDGILSVDGYKPENSGNTTGEAPGAAGGENPPAAE